MQTEEREEELSNNKLNFTYLLGAGASYETIPTVKRFKKGIEDFIDHTTRIDNSILHQDFQKKIVDFYTQFVNEINRSASVDTFIKKLDLSNDLNCNYYKLLLSTYIYYETITKESIDKRYDLFNASILEKVDSKIKIPDNVNIISWNYDRLYETSLQWILGENSKTINEFINIYSASDLPTTTNDSKLNLVKLNGTAGGYVPSRLEHMFLLKDRKVDLYRMIFSPLENPTSNGNIDKIRFAWDEGNEVKVVRNKAIEIMSKTDYLMIIGYSFPTFNRLIDFQLLKSLNSNCEIHLQIPESDIKSVKQRLLALMGKSDSYDKIFEHTETDEFYIPYEYNLPKDSNSSAIGILVT